MMNFQQLSTQIYQTHNVLQQSVGHAINKHLTARNWLIGCYIVEYEQKGEDRAKYGEKLMVSLSKNLHVNGLGYTVLNICRQFYNTYPLLENEIVEYLRSILQSPTEELQIIDNKNITTLLSVNKELPETKDEVIKTPPEKLFANLSFTHFAELIQINDPLKRAFYEIESIKGSWSVRTLKRQIESLCFERAGLSENPDLLVSIVRQSCEKETLPMMVKSPFVFDFLGLKSIDVVDECNLEQALIDHLQDFLLELGYGFCFEARQKKILIDSDFYSIDLVFYHRVLHCNVLIELKTEKFKHSHISQLNSYLEYYRRNEMHEGDNLPVGILLVSEKGNMLVEYAKGSMDNRMFVSKYLLELPSVEKLKEFLKQELL